MSDIEKLRELLEESEEEDWKEVELDVPAPKVHEYLSEDGASYVLSRFPNGAFNVIGTARMEGLGMPPDEGEFACLSNELNVLSAKGVRRGDPLFAACEELFSLASGAKPACDCGGELKRQGDTVDFSDFGESVRILVCDCGGSMNLEGVLKGGPKDMEARKCGDCGKRSANEVDAKMEFDERGYRLLPGFKFVENGKLTIEED